MFTLVEIEIKREPVIARHGKRLFMPRCDLTTLRYKLLAPERFAGLIEPQLSPLESAYAGGTIADIVQGPLDSTSAADTLYFVARRNEQILGFFALRERDALPSWAVPQNAMTLHHLRVDARCLGAGLGYRALGTAREWIQHNRSSVQKLMLAVNTRNLRAISLYERSGFSRLAFLLPGPLGEQLVMAAPII